jgi:hypothetical protein
VSKLGHERRIKLKLVMASEERPLCAFLKRLETVGGPLGVMRFPPDQVGTMTEEMRAATEIGGRPSPLKRLCAYGLPSGVLSFGDLAAFSLAPHFEQNSAFSNKTFL